MKNTRPWLAAVALCFVVVSVAAASAQDDKERFARDLYDSGMKFLGERRFTEALRDFKLVVDSYSTSRVAALAWLRIAEYQLEINRDLVAAQAAVDTLQKLYDATDSGPMAQVLNGRIIMSKGRAPNDVDSALASYERAMRRGTDAEPAAKYFAGEALRLTHRDEEAILRYRQVWTEFPRSEWTPRALLGEARCLVITAKPQRAMDLLQRVRQRFPGTPEAATAMAWNTILYRLYLRAPANAPPYQFSGNTVAGVGGKLKDIQGIAVDAAGIVYAAGKTGVTPFGPSGTPQPMALAPDASSVLFNRSGAPVVVCRQGLLSGAETIRLSVPKPDRTLRALDEIPAAAFLSTGDILAVDKSAKNIARFGADGKHIATFANVNAERLAVDVTDRIAALVQDGVEFLERDGKSLAKIFSKGTGYQFERPVDVAVDPFGHVYVLDRNKATVFVFKPQPQKLLAAFTIPEKSLGYFKRAVCFGLDAAGRLYIYDDGAEKIMVYQ